MGLALILAGTRTRFENVVVRAGDREFSGRPKRNVLTLRWPQKTLSVGTEVELEIEFKGENPLITRAIWVADKDESKSDDILPAWLTTPAELPDELGYLWELEVERRSVHVQMLSESATAVLLSTAAQSFDNLLEERRRANEIDRRVRAFFLELDERTHETIALPELLDSIDYVRDLLTIRIEIRAALGVGYHTPIFPFEEWSETDLDVISNLFQDLHSTHLVLDDGTDLMSWAFEQFSIDCAAVFHHDPLLHGQLASQGAPDGSLYFMFAELAFACVDNGVDVDFWEPHLLGLVRAAHSFVEHTDPTMPGSATWGQGNALAFQQGRWLSFTRRVETREDYDQLLAGMTPKERREALEDRFTSLLAQVFFETSVGATNANTRPLLHPATIVRPAGAPQVP